MSSEFEIRSLRARDVPLALELSDAAGWNQVAMDWRRIVDVEPRGCIGAWSGGRLVGTTTFVAYGDRLAWIGMVLVHAEHRRKGIGRTLFRTVMSELQHRNIPDIGLDATDLGRPLYHSEGFVDVGPIIRWQGVLEHSESVGGSVRETLERDLDVLCDLDRAVTGIDRRALFQHLFSEEGVRCLATNRTDAFCFLRPGRLAWQIGPLVATAPDSAAALLNAAAAVLDGREVVVDSPLDHASPLLASWGLTPRRTITRMTHRRVCRLLTDERLPAAMSFAWG